MLAALSVPLLFLGTVLGIESAPRQPIPHDVQHDYVRAHPSNIYEPYCRGGWVECGRDSAKNHQESNPNAF